MSDETVGVILGIALMCLSIYLLWLEIKYLWQML